MNLSEAELRGRARELSLQRLGRRDHSAHELEAYLIRNGIPMQIVNATIDRLKTDGLLDDRRYARVLTRSQALREKGPAFILRKLRQKGVRMELPELRALFDELSDRTELETARRLVTRRYPQAGQNPKALQRAYAALRRHGFSDEIARAALPGRLPELND